MKLKINACTIFTAAFYLLLFSSCSKDPVVEIEPEQPKILQNVIRREFENMDELNKYRNKTNVKSFSDEIVITGEKPKMTNSKKTSSLKTSGYTDEIHIWSPIVEGFNNWTFNFSNLQANGWPSRLMVYGIYSPIGNNSFEGILFYASETLPGFTGLITNGQAFFSGNASNWHIGTYHVVTEELIVGGVVVERRVYNASAQVTPMINPTGVKAYINFVRQ